MATTVSPPFSASFNVLLASCFFEAQRRQQRHLKIADRFTTPEESAWQISLPERLFGLSGLGIFAFDFFATSVPGNLLFVDANHPMVAHGRMDPPGPDAAIETLRSQFPDTPEFQASGIEGCDDTFIHGILSIAAVKTGALFYYRCPNNSMPGAAVWILVKNAIADPATTLPSIPANLASLTPPPPSFGTYDAVVAAFDAARPAGRAERLNEFRINYTSTMMNKVFPEGASAKDLFLGFLAHNGYEVRDEPYAPQSGQAQSEEYDAITTHIALVDGSPALSATFDSFGRMRSIDMKITAKAYADDGYSL